MNFLWIIKRWMETKMPVNSIALLDLHPDCLLHIVRFLPMEDAYSAGHSCKQLADIVSRLRVPVTIRNSNDLKYLDYFGAETRDVTVNTKRQFTVTEQMNLLSMMAKCTKISDLNLRSLNSTILSSEWFSKWGHKLVHLNISLMEFTGIIDWAIFIQSMRRCANLRSLSIAYDEDRSIYTLDELTQLFSITFPKLKAFRFKAKDYIDDPDEDSFVPFDAFLRHNRQVEIFEIIAAPLFAEYLEALSQCAQLNKLILRQTRSIDAGLIAKLMVLNKLPALQHTTLGFSERANKKMLQTLQRTQSLKELIVRCTLFEDFIPDILQLPHVTSLELIILHPRSFDFTRLLKNIFLARYGFTQIVKRLRYHEPNLQKLTKLDVSDPRNHTMTSYDLTALIKFIINCPKIELIELNAMFPLDNFYTEMLKYEKNFGHRTRPKTLHLKIHEWPMWIPGYSRGRRTHNIVILDRNGDEVSTSITSIAVYAFNRSAREIYWIFIFFCCLRIAIAIEFIYELIWVN